MQNSFFPAFDSICRSRFFLILDGLAVFCVISFVPAAGLCLRYRRTRPYHGGTTQQFHVRRLEDFPRRRVSHQPPDSRNHRNPPYLSLLTATTLLHSYTR